MRLGWIFGFLLICVSSGLMAHELHVSAILLYMFGFGIATAAGGMHD